MRAGSEYRNEPENSNAGEIGSEALIEKNGGRGWRVDDQECADPENERNEGERAQHPLGLHAAEAEKRGSFHQPANSEPSAMGFERDGDGKKGDGDGEVKRAQGGGNMPLGRKERDAQQKQIKGRKGDRDPRLRRE